MPRLVETFAGVPIRLTEHPGHPDQKVHNPHKRGQMSMGLTNDEIEDFLRRPVTITSENGDSGVNPSYIGTIDGQKVFVKVMDLDELEGERAAQALNDTFGPLVSMKRLVWHDPDSIDYGRQRQPWMADGEVMVQEWAHGYRQGGSAKYSVVVNKEQMRDMALFDLVIANTDRHDGNWMADGKGNVLVVDNSRAFWGFPGSWSAGLPAKRQPFTPRQRQFLQKIVDAGPEGVRKAIGYYKPHEADGIHFRATELLKLGGLPGQDEMDWGGQLQQLFEARLEEHPGHSPQSVHNPHKSKTFAPSSDSAHLMGKITNVVRMQGGGMNPSFIAEIDGRKVFVKQVDHVEGQVEAACVALNEFGGGLVTMPNTVLRSVPLGDLDPRALPQPGPAARPPRPPAMREVVVQDLVPEGYQKWGDVEGRETFKTNGPARDPDWFSKVSEEAKNDVNVFDFVTVNGDRHKGNLLVNSKGQLVAVDHGLSMGRGGMYPREYLWPSTRAPLTPKQKQWLGKVSSASVEELQRVTGVDMGRARVVKERAEALLQFGYTPTFGDVGAFQYGPGFPKVKKVVQLSLPSAPAGASEWGTDVWGSFGHGGEKVGEALLQEHPGHSDQKVHGRRGSLPYSEVVGPEGPAWGALRVYKGAFSQDFNGLLRHGLKWATPERRERVRQDIRAIDAAMQPLPKRMTLYRGTDGDEFPGFDMDEATRFDDFGRGTYEQLVRRVGETYVQPGYTSTAPDANSNLYYIQRAVRMKIVAPKGTRAIRPPDDGYEPEVLLDRGTKFRIKSVTLEDFGPFKPGRSVVNVEVEVVDQTRFDLSEALLLEHPGHASQKVHGRRGGVIPELDDAEATGILIDDFVRKRFTGDSGRGLAKAIFRVDAAFPGAIRGAAKWGGGYDAVILKTESHRLMGGEAGRTRADGSVIIISDRAAHASIPAFYQPKGNHSFSAGGDTAEGVLTHELMHAVLDRGGQHLRTPMEINGRKVWNAYEAAKQMKVPTKYAEGDRGDGRERAAELLTQAIFGQPNPEAKALYDAVRAQFVPKVSEARLEEHPGHSPQSVHNPHKTSRDVLVINIKPREDDRSTYRSPFASTASEDPEGLDPGSDADVDEFLLTGRLSVEQALGGGVSGSYVATIDGAKAVVKPAAQGYFKGEDFKHPGDETDREVAARVVNDLMGGLVPMPRAVARTLTSAETIKDGVPGKAAVIEWVDGKTGRQASATEIDKAFRDHPDFARDVAIFDMVTGDSDRHEKNWMVTTDGKPVLIDSSLAFGDWPVYHQWSTQSPITDRQRTALQSFVAQRQKAVAELAPVVGKARIEKALGRAQVILETGISATPDPVRVDQVVHEWQTEDVAARFALGEARLEEHPGHSPQSVHGHRGVDRTGEAPIAEVISEQEFVTGLNRRHGIFSGNYTMAQREALLSYQGDGFRSMNRSLRTGAPLSAEDAKRAELLDRAFSRAKPLVDGLVVQRSYGDNPPGEGRWVDSGFVSTSATQEGFRGVGVMGGHEIEVPAGTRAIFLPGPVDELLLPRNLTFERVSETRIRVVPGVEEALWSARMTRLVRLFEHPGHQTGTDQSVHGRHRISPRSKGTDLLRGRQRKFATADPTVTRNLPATHVAKMRAQLKADFGVTTRQLDANLTAALQRGLADPDSVKGLDWYGEAHDTASRIARENGLSDETGVAIVAALSPQHEWGSNVAAAEYTTKMLRENPTIPDLSQRLVKTRKVNGVTIREEKTLEEWARAELAAHRPPIVMPKVVGTRLADHDVFTQASMIKAMSQAGYGTVDGKSLKFVDEYADGRTKGVQWSCGLDGVSKAVRIYRGESPDAVLNGHKVRSFNNNMLAGHPSEVRSASNWRDVTIDTHAVSAAVNRKYAASSDEMNRFTGTPSLASHGASGLYPLFADSYRRVAEKAGLRPEQAQAVIWLQWRKEHP